MDFQKYTDDIIGLVVIVSGTVLAGYVTYLTGQIPEFFAVGFGLVIGFHFRKENKSDDE